MAQRYLFFNSTSEDRRKYDATDFADYFGSILSTGLLHTDEVPGLSVSVEQGTMNTVVSAGKAIMKGHLYENTTPYTLTHSLPEPNLDRIDRVILRLDLRQQQRNILLHVKEGVSSNNPEPPALQRDDLVYEISLAQVLVRRNTSTLRQVDLTDERLDEDVCGLVYSLISIPTDQLQAWITAKIDELDGEAEDFGQYLSNLMQEYQDNLAQWEQEWQDWFDSIQGATFATLNQLTEHANKYASETESGHVKVDGETITIDSDGVISASTLSSDSSLKVTFDDTMPINYPVHVYNSFPVTRYSTPSTFPNAKVLGSYSGDGRLLAITTNDSIGMAIYKESDGDLVKIPNPSTLPTGTINSVALSDDGTCLAVAHSNSPYITLYRRTEEDTFEKVANPNTLPPRSATSVVYNRRGTQLAVGVGGSEHVIFYNRVGDEYTKLPNPSNAPSSTSVYKMEFNQSGDTLVATSEGQSNNVVIYTKSNLSYTGSVLINGNQSNRGASFGRGDVLVVSDGSGGGIKARLYNRTGNEFELIDTNPFNLPSGSNVYTVDVKFNKEGDIVFVSLGTSVSLYRLIGERGFEKIEADIDVPSPVGYGFEIIASSDFTRAVIARDGASSNPRNLLYKSTMRCFKGDIPNNTDKLSVFAKGVTKEAGLVNEEKKVMILWRD